MTVILKSIFFIFVENVEETQTCSRDPKKKQSFRLGDRSRTHMPAQGIEPGMRRWQSSALPIELTGQLTGLEYKKFRISAALNWLSNGNKITKSVLISSTQI